MKGMGKQKEFQQGTQDCNFSKVMIKNYASFQKEKENVSQKANVKWSSFSTKNR